MEITGPDRLNVSSSIELKIAGIRKVESITLAKEEVGSKLAGCAGCRIGTLLARVRPNLGNGVSGVFTASDGAATDPIPLSDLTTGWLVHSSPTASELPGSLGGPLRVVFPEGSRVTSICGKSTPLSLKGAMRLELYSAFELKDATLHQEISARAPQMITEMEQEHMASLLAFAKLHGGVARPTNVAVEGLDARGLTLRVTDELSGVVTDQVLVPFPRPLESMDDVAELFVEMHRAAFAALPFSFKLRSRYYSEPATVALRKALKAACSSPTAVPVAAAAAIAVAAAGVLLLRTAGRMRR